MKWYLQISALVFSLLLIIHIQAVAQDQSKKTPFHLSLVDGTSINIEADDQVLHFNVISKAGKKQRETIQLADIKHLEFTSVAAKIAQVKIDKLWKELNADRYQTREAAQAKLIETGGAFRHFLKSKIPHASVEAKWRLKVILEKISSSKAEQKHEWIELQNGTKYSGITDRFALEFQFQDQVFQIEKRLIQGISQAAITPFFKSDKQPVTVTLHHDAKAFDYTDPERFLDFQKNRGGQTLAAKQTIAGEFSHRGIAFEAEQQGYVGVSAYSLRAKYPKVSGNSVCVFGKKRFTGNMRISFHLPGNPELPAGVRKFGITITRIDNPRDFILEAYNENSHLLGTVESTSDGVNYFGIESNEPIAYVRILSNPYLHLYTSRKIDSSYAVDGLWTDKPTPLSNLDLIAPTPGIGQVFLRSGERLSCQELTLSPNGESVLALANNFDFKKKISFTDIAEIRFGDTNESFKPTLNTRTALRLPNKDASDWFVMLADRSVLKVLPGENFQSTLFDRKTIPKDRVIGLWAARNQVRFPFQNAFKNGKQLLVFPIFQSIANVTHKNQALHIKNGIVQEQAIFLDKKTESLVPNMKEAKPILLNKPPDAKLPTVWFHKPSLADSTLGIVRLVDGQQLVLGGASQFRLKSLTQDFALVTGPDDWSVKIPRTQIRSIKFKAR